MKKILYVFLAAIGCYFLVVLAAQFSAVIQRNLASFNSNISVPFKIAQLLAQEPDQ